MLRMPLHPVALELLRDVGPMAVSSANISGRPPATTVAEAPEQLGRSVAVYLDGGAVPGRRRVDDRRPHRRRAAVTATWTDAGRVCPARSSQTTEMSRSDRQRLAPGQQTAPRAARDHPRAWACLPGPPGALLHGQ